MRYFRISYGGNARYVKSEKGHFDVARKFYADILPGQFMSPPTYRFHSDTLRGYIWVTEYVTEFENLSSITFEEI